MTHKLKERPLFVVFFTLFIDLLGYGILIPVIPQLFANPDSTYFLLPTSYSLDHGYILLGLLLGIYPLMRFFATPILGQLSDRYGRRKILAISLVGTSLSYIVFAIAVMTRNLPLLFISRAFDGITGGNIAVAQAAIADISTPETRSRNFGLIGVALGLGFIVGPYIGGQLSDPDLVSWFSPATPFWFAAILSTLNMVSVMLLFSETLKNFNKQKMTWFQSLKNIAAAYNMRHMRIPFLASFLFQSGLTFFVTFFGVYLIQKFGFDQNSTGNFFAYVGFCIAVSQIFITRYIAKRLTEWKVLQFSLMGASVFIALQFLPNNPSQLYIIAAILAIFIALIQSNIPALISRSVGYDIQGEILGINSSISALAQAIPPILSGYIAATLNPNAPVIVAAMAMFAAACLFMFFYKPRLNH